MEKQAKGGATWPCLVKPNSPAFASDASQPQPSPFSFLSSKLLGQLLIHMSTVADGHQANDPCFLIDGIDDAKAANAIFPEPVEFPLERASTFWISGNGANGRLDRPFQIGVE